MKVPEFLGVNLIIDANIELRFDTNVFPNAVFGMLYNEFKTYYDKVERLPILQIPEQLLETDPNFKYKAH